MTQIRHLLFVIGMVFFGTSSLLAVSALEPHQVEFAWDIHDTVLEMNKTAMAKIFYQKIGPLKGFKMLGLLSYESIKHCLTGRNEPTYELIANIVKLLRQPHGTTNADYKKVIDLYDLSFWQVAEEMAACWDPIPGMAELIKELDELGYTQRVASNMGASDFQNLVAKYPSIFSCFKGGMTVNSEERPLVQKPLPTYFERYQNLYNADRKKIVIFIDDKLVNCNASEETGMRGIHMSKKNVAALREKLKAQGIPLRS